MEYLSIELQSLMVFCTQIVFLYLRTVNIRATADGRVWLAIWTNSIVGIMWLTSTAIGVGSIVGDEINFLPLTMHIIGGAVGTYLGFKIKTKDDRKNG